MRRWEATRLPAVRARRAGDRRGRARGRALDPSLHVVTIPNGVDAAHFAPPARRAVAASCSPARSTRRPTSGRAAARRADHAARAARDPGRAPDDRRPQPRPAVRALERVVADVPDLRPYLWGAAVYACPMDSGTGIKNKLLEAMAAGAPAVATPLACQGIDVARSICWSPTSDAGVRRRRSSRCSRDRERAAQPADAARAYVRARHDWDAVAAAYRALYARSRPALRIGHPLRARGPRRDERAVGRQRRALDAAEPACCRRRSCSSSRSSSRATSARPTWAARATSRSSSIALVQAATAGFPSALSRFVGELLGARRGGQALSLYRFTRRVELRRGGARAGGAGRPSRCSAASRARPGCWPGSAPRSRCCRPCRWRCWRARSAGAKASLPGLVTGVATVPLTIVVLEAGGGITGLFAARGRGGVRQPRVDVARSRAGSRRSCPTPEPAPRRAAAALPVLRRLDVGAS